MNMRERVVTNSMKLSLRTTNQSHNLNLNITTRQLSCVFEASTSCIHTKVSSVKIIMLS